MNRIALVMIVRDEARSLERCLASALPWVDETVVVDTGSRDATIEIARRLGARVGHFAWSDDFAAARNAALALTDASWRLVLDGDEWISDGGDSLAALRARGARVHRPDQRRERVRRRPTARSATRRAGCRASCRAAFAIRAGCTSSRSPRCRAGACALVVGHDGYRAGAE